MNSNEQIWNITVSVEGVLEFIRLDSGGMINKKGWEQLGYTTRILPLALSCVIVLSATGLSVDEGQDPE